MDSKVLLCDNSFEGLCSTIYYAYQVHCNHNNTRIMCKDDYDIELFCEYEKIDTSEESALKVAKSIIRDFGESCFDMIRMAFATPDRDRFNYIYHMIVKGYSMRDKSNLIDALGDEYVSEVFALARSTRRESEHLRGFLRFKELEDGILFSTIHPTNDIIEYLVPHFSDRLPLENFVIYDEGRQNFVVHQAGKESVIVRGEKINDEYVNRLSANEKDYSVLFKYFVDKIAIQSRINPKLQRQMLPVRFREYMTEFTN